MEADDLQPFLPTLLAREKPGETNGLVKQHQKENRRAAAAAPQDRSSLADLLAETRIGDAEVLCTMLTQQGRVNFDRHLESEGITERQRRDRLIEALDAALRDGLVAPSRPVLPEAFQQAMANMHITVRNPLAARYLRGACGTSI